jgi:potassium-transporting ATPase ATP-binding subunit
MPPEMIARLRDGGEKPASELRRGDVVVVEAGGVIPVEGIVIEGIASVDESAVTGESAPVIRESGGDRSSVAGGTTVLSGRLEVQTTRDARVGRRPR